MDKIEYIARELAVLDGIDPDAPAVRAGYRMFSTGEAALLPPETVVHPAWVFYRQTVERIMAYSATFDAEHMASVEGGAETKEVRIT